MDPKVFPKCSSDQVLLEQGVKCRGKPVMAINPGFWHHPHMTPLLNPIVSSSHSQNIPLGSGSRVEIIL